MRALPPRLAALGLGVVCLHTLVTILEERLFALEAYTRVAGGTFMTLVMYGLTALLYFPAARRARLRRSAAPAAPKVGAPRAAWAPRAALLRVAAVYVGTTTLSKTSLRYIDMPTQTVLKSAKLLPVMAGSMAINGGRFTPREWAAAAMLCSGIAMFNLSTHFAPPRQTLKGAACLAASLVCDALLGPYQKRVLSQGVGVDELIFAQSALGGWGMLLASTLDGTLLPGLRLLAADTDVAVTLVSWSLAITAGTALLLRVVDDYSAVTAIVVTTVRKALTLSASFALFPKHLGPGHPLGAALVFASAFLSLKPSPKSPKPKPPLPTAQGG